MSIHTNGISLNEFEDLYSKYRLHFIAIARMYIRDEMAAEDVVMESFMAFWEKHETIEIEKDKVPAYILTSVKNRSLTWLRDRRTHDRVHHNIHFAACRLRDQNIGLQETTLPKMIMFQEVSDIIEAALRKMPERTRKVFLAHRIEEMSYKEIEELYALSKGQIHDHMQRAKKVLGVALKDYIALVGLLVFLY